MVDQNKSLQKVVDSNFDELTVIIRKLMMVKMVKNGGYNFTSVFSAQDNPRTTLDEGLV